MANANYQNSPVASGPDYTGKLGVFVRGNPGEFGQFLGKTYKRPKFTPAEFVRDLKTGLLEQDFLRVSSFFGDLVDRLQANYLEMGYDRFADPWISINGERFPNVTAYLWCGFLINDNLVTGALVRSEEFGHEVPKHYLEECRSPDDAGLIKVEMHLAEPKTPQVQSEEAKMLEQMAIKLVGEFGGRWRVHVDDPNRQYDLVHRYEATIEKLWELDLRGISEQTERLSEKIQSIFNIALPPTIKENGHLVH